MNVKTAKDDKLTHLKTANQLAREGKLEEAILSYQQAIEQNPNFYWYHHNLAGVMVKLGRWEEAANFYNQAIDINPNSTSCYQHLGEVYLKLNQIEKAILAYTPAWELNPNLYGVCKKLAKSFYQLAVELSSKHLELNCQLEKILPNKYLFYLKDEVFLEQTNTLNNEDFIEKVYLTYLNREADVEGTNNFLSQLDNGISRQEVILGFKQSLEFTSKLVPSIKLVFVEEAIAFYRRAIELKGTSDRKLQNNLAEALVLQGKLQEQQGSSQQAIETYKQVIDMEPNQAEILVQQGEAFEKQGQFNLAIKSYKQAIASNPNLPEAHYKLGNTLRDAAKTNSELEQAIESYRRAINLKLEWMPELEITIGNILVQQDKLDQAFAAFKKAGGIEETHYRLGIALLYHGTNETHLERAMENFKQALTINPNLTEVSKNLTEAEIKMGRMLVEKEKLNEALGWFEKAMGITDFNITLEV